MAKKLNDIVHVTRKLVLPAMTHESDVLKITELLIEVCNDCEIRTDIENQFLEITYDVTKTDYSSLIATLKNNGYSQVDNFISRLKANWFEFTESNMRETAKTPPAACCNKPPK